LGQTSENVARPRRAEWAVLALAALLWLPTLSGRDLWSPDEPRIAQVSEELRAAVARDGLGAAWVLQLNGAPYSQKPPLYYWTAAALGTPFGHVDPWAARLPSALAGLAGLALTMALARRLFPGVGARAAPWAGVLLALSFRWGELSSRASLDVVLSSLELAAILAWLRFARGEWTRERAALCLHGALGLAMLVKGPVALVPLAVIGLATLWNQRRGSTSLSERGGIFSARYFALSVGPLLIWGAAVLATTPAGFFHEAVVENLWGRFFSGTSHARPLFYYATQLPLEFLPSTLLLPAAFLSARGSLRSDDSNAASWRLLAVWTAVFVVFFSLSAGKRGSYLLPLFPALSLAAAVAMFEGFRVRERLAFRAGAISVGLAATLGGLASAALWADVRTLPSALGLGTSFEFPSLFLATLTATGLGGALTGLLAVRRGWSGERRAGAIAAGLVAVQLSVSHGLYPALDAERSLRPIAEAASTLARGNEPIGVFRHASLRPGLAYYAPGSPARFVDLGTRAEVDEFLSRHGRVLIAEQRRKQALGELPLPIQQQFRGGQRLVWVMAPDGRGDGPAEAKRKRLRGAP